LQKYKKTSIPESSYSTEKEKFIDLNIYKFYNLLFSKGYDKHVNSQRPHWSCHMKTPDQIHLQQEVKIRTYKKFNLIKASLDKVE
jgi:hypothetical protein